jgi:hypothetical protein
MSYDCSCDYDPPSVYNATTPRAKKQHRCTECSGPIAPGEHYERVFGVWDGYAGTHKTCERCFNLRTWVKNNVPCLCIMHGNQDEENEYAVDEARYRAPLETKGLRFGFLRRKILRERHNRQTSPVSSNLPPHQRE